MILVPRQLMRSGMTGDVPYYGGRFTPAQAYAASHPRPQPPVPPPPQPQSQPPVPSSAPPADPAETLRSLQHLLDTGVVSQNEFDGLRARVAG
jgi:hypothetical protein